MSIQMNSVSLENTEPLTMMKTEPPESEIVEIGINDFLDSSESEEIISDVKDIDIVYHLVCKESIKSEIFESKHCESVETQVLVKAENSIFIKTENITQRNKTEDTSDENATEGIGQRVVEVQDLNGIHTRSRKAKQPEKTNFAKCYKTASWKIDKEKIKVIKVHMIPVEGHEYTSLLKDKHVCNHCQHAYTALSSLKRHIAKIHREVTSMYQCPYCPYKSKWSVREHIIRMHKDTKDIQWFQCNLCEMKFKLKKSLIEHMRVHLKHKQIQDGLDLRRHHCNKCSYRTDKSSDMKNHKIIHLKPEEIEYFYCYHCSYKSKLKSDLKKHIFGQHFKNIKQGKRYGCNKCDFETYTSTQLKSHELSHLKPEELQYFYCYHCSYKSNRKMNLKRHIFGHFKKEQVEFDCYICNFMTPKRESIIKHIKKHSKVQNKSEMNEGS